MQVFCAPHIEGLSKSLGTTFHPIRYTLKEGNRIVSNVRYSSSIFKEGWLSASGTMEASGTNTLQIHFDKFWLDFGNANLRTELPGTHSPVCSHINFKFINLPMSITIFGNFLRNLICGNSILTCRRRGECLGSAGHAHGKAGLYLCFQLLPSLICR